MIKVNFKRYLVVGSYCKVRHFSREFDSLSEVAKFMDDHIMSLPDSHGRLKAIYLDKESGLTNREWKILNNKYRSLYARRYPKHGSV